MVTVIDDTGFGYKVNENESFFRIVRVNGGRIPESMEGGWTSVDKIKAVVASYMGRNDKLLSEEEKQAEALKAAKKRPSKLKAKED